MPTISEKQPGSRCCIFCPVYHFLSQGHRRHTLPSGFLARSHSGSCKASDVPPEQALRGQNCFRPYPNQNLMHGNYGGFHDPLSLHSSACIHHESASRELCFKYGIPITIWPRLPKVQYYFQSILPPVRPGHYFSCLPLVGSHQQQRVQNHVLYSCLTRFFQHEAAESVAGKQAAQAIIKVLWSSWAIGSHTSGYDAHCCLLRSWLA